MFRFVVRLVRDEATAEDVISEVFLDVWRQAKPVRRSLDGIDRLLAIPENAVKARMFYVNRPAISKCSRCGRTKYTQHLVFKQNVSYFFARKERQFSADLCFSCASRTFASVELTTLLLTWWGIIGFWLGPLYIVHNLVEYIIATFRFVRSEKYVRKGLLRLCVATGITWIGWLGYKSLDALADGSGWNDLLSIVWLILTVASGGPILIAWVVAGFQKSAV